MLNIHRKFCRETFYDGRLVDFQPVYQENFNFAYDVMDVIGREEPDRRAMLWCNEEGGTHLYLWIWCATAIRQLISLLLTAWGAATA